MAMRVQRPVLEVRAGPSSGEPVIGQALAGQMYPRLQEAGEWQQIQFGARQGWTQGGLEAAPNPVVRISAAHTWVRSGPGPTYRALGILAGGTLVVLKALGPGYVQIDFEGREAWVPAGVTAPVGAETYGAPPPVSRAGFIQLPAGGDGFYSYTTPGKRWGLPRLIYAIQRAGARAADEGLARIGAGDVSLTDGGYFPPHVSHRVGIDVDVRPLRTDRAEAPMTFGWPGYDRLATWRAIDLLRAEVPTKVVFFNDRAIPGTTPLEGHSNHFHLRVW
jgi:uncharacterized protein YraI